MPKQEDFIDEFCQTFKEGLNPIHLKLFQKMEEKGNLPKSFYEAGIARISRLNISFQHFYSKWYQRIWPEHKKKKLTASKYNRKK